MVILGGAELLLLKPLLAKLATTGATKALVVSAAHSSPAVLQHAAMSTVWNTTATAIATGTISSGAAIVIHSAWESGKFALKVQKYRDKHFIDSKGRKAKTFLGEARYRGNLVEQLMMAARLVLEEFDQKASQGGYDWEVVYRAFENVDSSGKIKTSLSEIKECNECSCGDFTRSSSGHCNCGHTSAQHSTPDNTHMMLSLISVTILLYPELGHTPPLPTSASFFRPSLVKKKTDITEIMPCTASVEGCPCYDFQSFGLSFAFGSLAPATCQCGHLSDAHQQTKAFYLHFYYGIIVEWLYRNLTHLDEDGSKKVRLSQIAECERCECRDYDFSYKMPFLEKYMCKCGCSRGNHKRLFNKVW